MRCLVSKAYFIGVVLVIVLGISAPVAQYANAQTAEKTELEARIKAKGDALAKLNEELRDKQEELRTTQNARASLQRDITLLEKNISQLQLSIKGDKLTAEKLSLEIDSLTYDIKDLERSIGEKTGAVGELLDELYRRDRMSPLIILLKSASLAETIAETEAIKRIKVQLREDAGRLAALREEMRAKLSDVSERKEEVELRQKNQIAKKAIIQDQQQTKKTVLVETKNKETEYARQLEELKKQQDALADEIEAIEEELRAKFDPSLAPTKAGGMFAWPIQLASESGKVKITQRFGERSYLYRGKPHNGLDVGAPIGTPIVAAADGIVIAVDNNDKSSTRRYQYGKYILIRHPNNLSTLYAHLSNTVVATGSTVKRGQLIGYSGKTGYATGPHLHFGAYWTASIEMKSLPPAAGLVPVGVTLNPEDYL